MEGREKSHTEKHDEAMTEWDWDTSWWALD